MKIAVLSGWVDRTETSEAHLAFKWIEALSRIHDVTLLCFQREGRELTADQLPGVRVVSWPEATFFSRFDRIRAQVKPQWPILCNHANSWLRGRMKAGEHFDIAHQLYPAAMRHSSPFRKLGIPYVIGPVAGSLPTPEAFENEVQDGFVGKLRKLDGFRLRRDPGLRATFANADSVIGAAPYVADVLRDIALNRFHVINELAMGTLPSVPSRTFDGPIKLLHVGRVVRTKGLRDVIRALADLNDHPEVTLTSAGVGPDLDACRREAESLGVADRVTFLGHVTRETVDELYRAHDVLAFPSFREPTGIVFLEAMAFGLPIIAARAGGAMEVLGDAAHFVEVTTPQRFFFDIANAIRSIATDPAYRSELSSAARARAESMGSWDDRARQVTELYQTVFRDRAARAIETLGDHL